MESSAVLRSFQYAVGTSSHLKTVHEKPVMLTMNSAAVSNLSRFPVCGGKIITCTSRRGSTLVACMNTSETTKSNSDPNGSVQSDSQNGSLENKSSRRATFPQGFEDLLTEVCDETKIAELKLKIGDFQIHIKRNIDGPTIPAPVVPQAAAPPVPSEPSSTAAPSPAPKSSAEKVSPFINAFDKKAAKLAALEASGISDYVIVSSTAVGSFRRGRTRKGKQLRPACKEGDIIKEGQIIGFVHQIDSETAIRSNVTGEVLKILYANEEPVGYGDPVLAVFPFFHNIK